MYLWYLEKIWRKSANPDTKIVSGTKLCWHDLAELAKSADFWLSGRHVADMSATFPAKPPLPHDKMTIKQLKSLLRKKGLPVTGRKADLMEWLKTGYNIQGPKPKPWQHSTVKKDLKRALLDPTSPIHGMSMEQICASDDRYKWYPNFLKYYNDLKGRV